MSDFNNTNTMYTNTYMSENIYNIEDVVEEPPSPTIDPIILPDYPIRPDFGFITDIHTRTMIESAYMAISQAEGWYIIRNFTGESFMFTSDQKIIDIMSHVNTIYGGGHSGASIGITMRHMEFIAKNGFIRYKMSYLS